MIKLIKRDKDIIVYKVIINDVIEVAMTPFIKANYLYITILRPTATDSDYHIYVVKDDGMAFVSNNIKLNNYVLDKCLNEDKILYMVNNIDYFTIYEDNDGVFHASVHGDRKTHPLFCGETLDNMINKLKFFGVNNIEEIPPQTIYVKRYFLCTL